MDTIYLTRGVEYGCSEGTKALAWFGGIVLIALLYTLMLFFVKECYLAVIKKKYNELDEEGKTNCWLYSVFWFVTIPLTVLIGGIYWLGKWILLPFTAAEKSDLREMETRINKKIILNGVNPSASVPTKKFQVGDLVTGIKGNPDNYKHLTEGSVSRVKAIDDKEIMSLVLIDHKDYAKHKDQIGETFKAPARNFVKFTRDKAKKR